MSANSSSKNEKSSVCKPENQQKNTDTGTSKLITVQEISPENVTHNPLLVKEASMENVMSSQPATSEEYQELVASCKQTAGEEFPKLPNQVVVSEGSSEHMITSTCKKLPKRVAFSEPMSSSRSPDDENNEGEDGNVSLTRNKKFKKAYETNEYMKLTKALDTMISVSKDASLEDLLMRVLNAFIPCLNYLMYPMHFACSYSLFSVLFDECIREVLKKKREQELLPGTYRNSRKFQFEFLFCDFGGLHYLEKFEKFTFRCLEDCMMFTNTHPGCNYPLMVDIHMQLGRFFEDTRIEMTQEVQENDWRQIFAAERVNDFSFLFRAVETSFKVISTDVDKFIKEQKDDIEMYNKALLDLAHFLSLTVKILYKVAHSTLDRFIDDIENYIGAIGRMIFFVKSTVYHHIKKFLNGIKNNEGYDRILTNTVCSETINSFTLLEQMFTLLFSIFEINLFRQSLYYNVSY